MFELATPWVFLLLPLPYVIWRFFPSINARPTQALWIPFFAEIKALYLSQSKKTFPPFWLWASWLLSLIALSGPRFVGEIVPIERNGHHIMLALDISGSMALDDMIVQNRRYQRLDVVQYAAKNFVNQRTQDDIGLVLFGSKAYLLTPLTQDKKHILSRINDASVGLAGQATAIGDAIGLSIKHLKKTPPKGRILILLTDGVNNAGTLSPQKATELALHEKIKIYTIGLGSDANLLTPFGMAPPSTELDEEGLKKIAEQTGGKYFRANDLDSLQQIYGFINQIETVKQNATPLRPQTEYYPWPLSIAFVLFFFGLFYERTAIMKFRRENPR